MMMNMKKPSREKSEIISCTVAANSPYTLYTCPANCRARLFLVFVSNANGTNTVTMRWYRASTDTALRIVGGKNMSQGEYFQLSDGYIVLEPGDKITISIGSDGLINALCTVEETFIPVGV